MIARAKPAAHHGFPRSHRLTKPAEFEAVFRQSEIKIHRKALRIRARQNRMLGARLGLVVAKRVVPKACDRNRLKRVCREAFRRRWADLPSVDMVVQIHRAVDPGILAGLFQSALDELGESPGVALTSDA